MITHFRKLFLTLCSVQANLAMTSESRAIATWLSPINFIGMQKNIFQLAKKGTCQILLNSAPFRDWVSGGGQTLWCPGKRKATRHSFRALKCH